MNAKGIYRIIDDLGRIVIPKEVRNLIGIKAGDTLEIALTNEGVLIKPFSNKKEQNK